MSEGKVIEFANVSMVFGDVPAVDSLTARADPGRVTAILGPNGAGKTTTLRALLGELRPSRGRATIGGVEFSRIARPATSIGAVMSIASLDRARRKSAIKHLTKMARRAGVGTARVRQVLTIVGLGDMADMRIDSLSLGMKHRLAVAEALLGDPGVLVFDEPANGLDPEGIRWIRLLMRRFADEGRTVVMSSHVLSEVEQVADDLLILDSGRLLFDGPIELLSEAGGGAVTVDAEDRVALTDALDEAGLNYRQLRSGIAIDDTTASEVGALAAAQGIALTTLTQRGPTLEDVYLQIIEGSWSAPARTAALEPSAVTGAPAAEPSAHEPGPTEPDAADDDVASDAADDDTDAATDDDTAPDDATEGDDPSDDGIAVFDPLVDDANDADDSESTDAVDEADADDEADDADDSLASDALDEQSNGSATAAVAGATALPGLAGLAGLAAGLRSDDEDGAGEDLPDDAVSPGVRAAFAQADDLERDADAIEADVVAAEARAEVDDEWEAQLRAMFEDEAPAADPVATEAFPSANFELPDAE